jgi:ubiquinone/menaquinone biosynthesis C-methylase UbiE
MSTLFAYDVPPRIDEPELIDDATQPYCDLRDSMRDVRRVNRFLGGTAATTRQVRRWLQASQPAGHRAIRLLDLATGTGDIPQAVLRVAQQVGATVQITGLDYSEPILQCAREYVAPLPAIRLLRGNALHLPFAAAGFDYVLCSLAFHHFTPEQCIAILREMERVARCGWLVNDLRRARSARLLIRVVMAVVGANRLTRHDAPVSVSRAYTPDEFRGMARELGLDPLRDYRVQPSLFYRMTLVRDKKTQFRSAADDD